MPKRFVIIVQKKRYVSFCNNSTLFRHISLENIQSKASQYATFLSLFIALNSSPANLLMLEMCRLK